MQSKHCSRTLKADVIAERAGCYSTDSDGNVTPVDCMTWAKAHEDPKQRIVGLDLIGKLKVSTVFFGLDQNWGEGPPILWETMVFGLPDDVDEIQLRYSSKADALEGHKRTCDEMRALVNAT